MDRQRVLFICSQNVYRSPTAEALYRKEPDLEVSSAGTNVDAVNPVSAELIHWAETIVVMEQHHRQELLAEFSEEVRGKKIVVLGIRDIYRRMEPALVDRLRATEGLWRQGTESF